MIRESIAPKKGDTPVLVLLHGWGCDSASWSSIIAQLQSLAEVITVDLPGFGASPALENFSLDAVVDYIAAELPRQSVLMGWSLGGMLALQVAARYPESVARVITLAANVKFVAAPGYPWAMAAATNRQFNAGFAADPGATLKLFSGLLTQGDENERALLKQIRALVASQSITANWQGALQLLSELDNREIFSNLSQPGLHLLADKDALVPATAAAALTKLNPRQQVHLVTQAAHALHWSQPQKVMELIAAFLRDSLTADGDPSFKKRVAQSFSRAAHSYDAVAGLQRDVGEQLLQKVEVDPAADVVLDLGCGTGYFIQALAEKFPQAYVVAMDLAETMLEVAKSRSQLIAELPRRGFLCGDAEQLPLASGSVDVIFSSLALQWCHNLPLLFSELNRVLKPGGKLFFSTLGPQTLHELKSAWKQVDTFVHVNRFTDMAELRTGLEAGKFFVNEFVEELPVLQFDTLSDLTRELKALGAHNINRGQAEGLTGRKKIAAFKAAYENFRRENTLPASYHIFYIAAEKLSCLQ